MPVLKNPRHERFAQELAAGKSAAEAYELAGYKPNRGNAASLKQDQSISTRVAELLQERAEMHAQATAEAVQRISLTKEWVLERLIENAERALQARQVKDSEGNPTGEYKYDGAVANRALELLGKELGMFIDRKQVQTVDEFDAITDPIELRRRLVEQAKELGARDVAATLAGGSGASGGKPH